MTDSDSLRGDIDRHTNLPQCCGELEIIRALLRPRMAETGDPTPTEALRGMFIEIERLRARDGRRRPMDEAIIADNENAIARLTSELAAERKLARAAGEGHDRARALLEAIASVFGRVDDFDALPAMVTKLEEQRAALVRAGEYDRGEVVVERQRLAEANQRIDEMKQTLATGVEKREALEDRLSREIAKTREMGAKQVAEAVAWCTVNAGRGLAAELAQDAAHRLQRTTIQEPAVRWAISQALHVGVETAISWADSHWAPRLTEAQREAKIRGDALKVLGWDGDGHPEAWAPRVCQRFAEKYADERVQAHIEHAKKRVAEVEADLATLTTAIGNAAKEVGVLCEGRTAVDILPDVLADMKRRVELAAKMDAQRAQWAHEVSAQAQAEAQADSVTFVREHEIKAARWSAICEAFGLDPEEDPPASIPAILAGDRWTNTRRMLADACANLRAPTLEVILGELVQTLGKSRGKPMDQALVGAAAGGGKLHWHAQDQAQAQQPARPSWRSWLIGKSTGLTHNMSDDELRAAFDAEAAESRCLTDARIDSLQAELGVHAATIAETETQTEKLVAALNMQALAILGWQDGSPVEWATKRAAAEADLRGALAEAELVGNDHAAMVRHLWNNLRGTAAKLDDTARLCNEATSSHARAEKRLSTWRAWAAGFCPMGFDASASDDSIIAALAFVPVSAYNREISALQVELAHQRALVSVMVDIKRRLIALKDLSP